MCFSFKTGVYSNTVVLQHHSVVMTKADKIYKVKCTYDMSSKNITFGMVPIRSVELSHVIAIICRELLFEFNSFRSRQSTAKMLSKIYRIIYSSLSRDKVT